MTAFTLCASALGIVGSIGGLCAVTQKTLHLMNKSPFVRSRYMEDSNRRPCTSMIPELLPHAEDKFEDSDLDNGNFFGGKGEAPGRGCVSIS